MNRGIRLLAFILACIAFMTWGRWEDFLSTVSLFLAFLMMSGIIVFISNIPKNKYNLGKRVIIPKLEQKNRLYNKSLTAKEIKDMTND